jgi:hypothetical protein
VINILVEARNLTEKQYFELKKLFFSHQDKNMASTSSIKPTNQRLEDALNLNPFMVEAESILNSAIDSEDDSDASDYEKYLNYEQKALLYNSESLDEDRKWLYNTLLSDTESESEISDEEKYVGELLRDHVKQKKIRTQFHQDPTVSAHQISSG